MTKICEHCGKEYEPQKGNQRYCCGRCRTAAFREKQDARKKAVRAYKDRTQQAHSHVYKGISEEDPRRRLARMKSQGILSTAYWEAFAEVDKQFNGGSGIVNGIPTAALPSFDFAEAVIFQIIEDGRIYACINKDKENMRHE